MNALSWSREEAKSCEAEGRWFATAWHLSRLLEANAENSHLLACRGHACTMQGRWDKSIADPYRKPSNWGLFLAVSYMNEHVHMRSWRSVPNVLAFLWPGRGIVGT